MARKNHNVDNTVQNIYMLYARVSPKGSQWSSAETSIAVQFADMKRRVLNMNPAARFIEVFDEFKSGKDLRRDGVQRILADLSLPVCPWHCLVVWNLDRLSRSITDAIPIFSKLRDAGCDFISINQEYLSCTGAMSRFMLHQTIAIAELERGMNSERVLAKMRWMVEQGKTLLSRAPLGYRRSPAAKFNLEIEESEATAVRYIFERFCAGDLHLTDVQERFPGKVKNRQHLYKILANPIYVGEYHFADVQNNSVPPIIPREVFNKAMILQEGFQKQYKSYSRKKHNYLLSGLLHCHCGRRLTNYSVTKKGKSYFYYKCTDPECKQSVNANALEEAVLNKLVEVYSNADFVRRSLDEYTVQLAEEQSELAPQRKRLELELVQSRQRMENITNTFLSGVVNAANSDFWNLELANIRRKCDELELELAKLPEDAAMDYDYLLPQLVEYAQDWAKKIASGADDFASQKAMVLSVVQDITCVSSSAEELEFTMQLVLGSSVTMRANINICITVALAMARRCSYAGTKKAGA